MGKGDAVQADYYHADGVAGGMSTLTPAGANGDKGSGPGLVEPGKLLEKGRGRCEGHVKQRIDGLGAGCGQEEQAVEDGESDSHRAAGGRW